MKMSKLVKDIASMKNMLNKKEKIAIEGSKNAVLKSVAATQDTKDSVVSRISGSDSRSK